MAHFGAAAKAPTVRPQMRLAPDMDRPARPWAGLILLGLVALAAYLPLLSLQSETLTRLCPTILCFLTPQRVVPFTVSSAPHGPIISPWIPIGYWAALIAAFGWLLRRATLRLATLGSIAMLLVGTLVAHVLIGAIGWHFFFDGP